MALAHWGAVLPAPAGLVQHGPLVEVEIVTHPALARSGVVVKSPGAVKLMVDTGAERTLIDDSICQQLGVPPVRYIKVVGVSGMPQDCPVYLIGLRLGFSEGPATAPRAQVVFAAEIVGMPSPATGALHSGLLGRDFLMNFQFLYNGPQGTFAIQLPAASSPPPASGVTPPRPQPQASKAKRRAQRDARKKNRR